MTTCRIRIFKNRKKTNRGKKHIEKCGGRMYNEGDMGTEDRRNECFKESCTQLCERNVQSEMYYFRTENEAFKVLLSMDTYVSRRRWGVPTY